MFCNPGFNNHIQGANGTNQMIGDICVYQPDSAIAKGAAVHSALRRTLFNNTFITNQFSDVVMLNCTDTAFGVNTTETRRVVGAPKEHVLLERQVMDIIIPAQTIIPFNAEGEYVPRNTKQTEMLFYVLCGPNHRMQYVIVPADYSLLSHLSCSL